MPRFAATRPIGESFNQNSESRRKGHRDQHYDRRRRQRFAESGAHPGIIRGVISHVGAKHEYVAVSEIDQPQNAIDHGVAQRNQCVGAALGDTVDDLLKKLVQSNSAVKKLISRLRWSPRI